MDRIELTPSEILFSQGSIKNRFGDDTYHRNTLIGETVDDIISGKCNISDIPTISVVKRSGIWVTADNRRLWVFKKLHKLGKCDKITVKVTKYLNPKKNCVQSTTRIRQHGNAGGSLWRILESQINAGVSHVRQNQSVDAYDSSTQRSVLLESSTTRDLTEVQSMFDSDTSSLKSFSSVETKLSNYFIKESEKGRAVYSGEVFSIPVDSVVRTQCTNNNSSNNIRQTSSCSSSLKNQSYQGPPKYSFSTDKTVSAKISTMSNIEFAPRVSHSQDHSTSTLDAASFDKKPILYSNNDENSTKSLSSENSNEVERLSSCVLMQKYPQKKIQSNSSVCKNAVNYHKNSKDSLPKDQTMASTAKDSYIPENVATLRRTTMDDESYKKPCPQNNNTVPSTQRNCYTSKTDAPSRPTTGETVNHQKTPKDSLTKDKTVSSTKTVSYTSENVATSRHTTEGALNYQKIKNNDLLSKDKTVSSIQRDSYTSEYVAPSRSSTVDTVSYQETQKDSFSKDKFMPNKPRVGALNYQKTKNKDSLSKDKTVPSKQRDSYTSENVTPSRPTTGVALNYQQTPKDSLSKDKTVPCTPRDSYTSENVTPSGPTTMDAVNYQETQKDSLSKHKTMSSAFIFSYTSKYVATSRHTTEGDLNYQKTKNNDSLSKDKTVLSMQRDSHTSENAAPSRPITLDAVSYQETLKDSLSVKSISNKPRVNYTTENVATSRRTTKGALNYQKTKNKDSLSKDKTVPSTQRDSYTSENVTSSSPTTGVALNYQKTPKDSLSKDKIVPTTPRVSYTSENVTPSGPTTMDAVNYQETQKDSLSKDKTMSSTHRFSYTSKYVATSRHTTEGALNYQGIKYNDSLSKDKTVHSKQRDSYASENVAPSRPTTVDAVNHQKTPKDLLTKDKNVSSTQRDSYLSKTVAKSRQTTLGRNICSPEGISLAITEESKVDTNGSTKNRAKSAPVQEKVQSRPADSLGMVISLDPLDIGFAGNTFLTFDENVLGNLLDEWYEAALSRMSMEVFKYQEKFYSEKVIELLALQMLYRLTGNVRISCTIIPRPTNIPIYRLHDSVKSSIRIGGQKWKSFITLNSLPTKKKVNISLSKIYYTRNSILSTFNGRSITKNLIEVFSSGMRNHEVNVMEYENKYYSLENEKLWGLKQAEKVLGKFTVTGNVKLSMDYIMFHNFTTKDIETVDVRILSAIHTDEEKFILEYIHRMEKPLE